MVVDFIKRQAEREHYMPMVPATLPPEVDKWIEDVCFGGHQYLAYDRGSRYLFCSHCGQHISLKDWSKERIHQLIHLRKGNCPECNWEATFICMGRFSKRVMRSDEALFLIAQRTPEGLIFRRFDLVRQIEADLWSLGAVAKTTLHWREVQRVFSDGTVVKHWCPNVVFDGKNGCWTVEWRPSKKREFGLIRNMGYEKLIEEYEYTGNLQDVVAGTCFQYSAEYKDRCTIRNVLEKLMTWIRPVEYLERMEWQALAEEIRRGRKLGINLKAATPEKMLRLPKKHIKTAAENGFNLDELVVFRRAIKEGKPINSVAIRWIAQYAGYLIDIRLMAPEFDPYRICPGATSGSSVDPYLYKDYIKFCRELEYDLTDPEILYPHDLRAAHDREMKRVKAEKDDLLKAKVAKRFNADSKQFGFVTPKFMIRPPVSIEEIHSEGAVLHHCVGSYAAQVAAGQTTILFLRKVEKPDKPFYTLEWRNNRLTQIRGDHNVEPTPEVAEFIKAWQTHMTKPKKQPKQKQKQPAMMPAAM